MQCILSVEPSSAIVFLSCAAVLFGYAVRIARKGRPTYQRLGKSPGSVLLPGYLVEAFYWALHAPGRSLSRLPISVDTITYLSVACSVASAPFLAFGNFRTGAACILMGAVLDGLDGMVARTRNEASPSGAVLDSFVDRVADSAPYLGLAIFYRTDTLSLLLVLLAMNASFLVSYARAKADIYELDLPNGFMRRHERIVYLVLSLVLGAHVPYHVLSGTLAYPIVLLGVSIILVFALCAAIVLVWRTRRALSVRAEPMDKRSSMRWQGTST